MHDRSQFRTKIVGLRVTEFDYGRLQSLADAHGQSLGEWCRDTLIAIANHPSGTPIEQALLSELIALRTIVANLVYAFTSEGKTTREQMAAFVDRADKTKLKRATELLSKIRQNGTAQSNVEPQGSGGTVIETRSASFSFC
jgi:hypothetical protein